VTETGRSCFAIPTWKARPGPPPIAAWRSQAHSCR
jgi:hypothetical protein